MSLLLPISYVAAIATSAHASDPRVFDGIWVCGAGNITVTFQQGPSIAFVGVPAGTLLPFKTRLITAATATGLIGLIGPSNPYCFNSAFIIAPHDTNPNIYDAIWVNATGAGALAVVGRDSSAVVTLAVAVGQLVPIRTKLVKAATTATVVGLRF